MTFVSGSKFACKKSKTEPIERMNQCYLQENLNLGTPNWTNSPSGFTNPITVPASGPVKYYRLHKALNP